MFDPREILSAGMVLFAVIDIIGNIPLVITLREKVGHIQSGKASIVSACIMIAFLFIGEEILNLIGIDINSFAVAGSFVLLFMALEMILGVSLYRDDVPETASIVPLAFPMIAGAGTMTSLLSLRAEYDVVNIIVAIVINVVIVYAILKSSKGIQKVLGKSGINIIRKVFGIVLLAIAVKLFTTNIGQLI
ncbi:MAG: MarC family protein [Bacteroidetes bacterium]|jgi:multiple antibiotic resistance protein|nr:MarC family protein [Bacteroidota bacterium]MDA0937881.1 MarC family protein [Bacteroidota bacterium]MDA1344089.1 MarC family protein [Bacteroidota bacterium]